MVRLDSMSVFVTVADAGGFATAAKKLGMSPSAVTRSIAALEDQLGIRLIQRTTRSSKLTDAGTRYLERARRILLDVEEAESAARAERTEPTGRVVVSAPVVFGRMKVAPVMSAYLARYRGVVGELLLADRFVSLVDEGVDLAVRIGHLADASLFARKVGETRRVLVAAPSYLAERKRPRSARELVGHDLVHCTSLSATAEWTFAGPRGPIRVPVAPRFVTNAVDTAIAHAEAGGGLTMALAYQVEEAVRAKRLAIVLPSYELPPLPIQLVYATKRHLSANVRALVEQITSTCAWTFVKLGA